MALGFAVGNPVLLALLLEAATPKLMELFLSHPQRIVSREELSDRLWSLDHPIPTDTTIKSHICHLRQKLGQGGAPGLIQTRQGQGYCLNPHLAESTPVPKDPK